MSFGSKADQGYLSFAKGFVTEYNPLAAPEGTTFDELNMDIDTDGFVRTRRPPLVAASIEAMSSATGSIEYAAAWEDQDKILLIVKRGDTEPVTGDFLIDVLVYSAGANPVKEFVLYFQIPQQQYVQPVITFLRKRALLILGGSPILIEKASTSYNVYEISLLVRDFKLLDDGLGTSNRPSTLAEMHQYNLYNAGWWQNRRLLSSNSVGDPVEDFKTIRGVYPSNADISYLGDITDSDGDLKFKPLSFDNIDLGSTEAPRGHYIFNITNIDREVRRVSKTLDGSTLATINPIIEEGNDPGTGLPPSSGDPVSPPPTFCDPDTGICFEIP